MFSSLSRFLYSRIVIFRTVILVTQDKIHFETLSRYKWMLIAPFTKDVRSTGISVWVDNYPHLWSPVLNWFLFSLQENVSPDFTPRRVKTWKMLVSSISLLKCGRLVCHYNRMDQISWMIFKHTLTYYVYKYFIILKWEVLCFGGFICFPVELYIMGYMIVEILRVFCDFTKVAKISYSKRLTMSQAFGKIRIS